MNVQNHHSQTVASLGTVDDVSKKKVVLSFEEPVADGSPPSMLMDALEEVFPCFSGYAVSVQQDVDESLVNVNPAGCPVCRSIWCRPCVLGKMMSNVDSAFQQHSGESLQPTSLSWKVNPLYPKETPVMRWERIVTVAETFIENSEDWEKAWIEAYKFAVSMQAADYHFHLNAARALTRLGRIKEARYILRTQLGAVCRDRKYTKGVIKQLAFLDFMEQNYSSAIQRYMKAIDKNELISRNMHNILAKCCSKIVLAGDLEGAGVVSLWIRSLRVRGC